MSFIILLLLLFFILFNLVTADAKAYNILSSSLDYIVSTDLPNKNVFVVMIGSSITNYLIYDNTGSVIKELTELKTDTGTTAPSYTERNNLKAMNDSFVVLEQIKIFISSLWIQELSLKVFNGSHQRLRQVLYHLQ